MGLTCSEKEKERGNWPMQLENYSDEILNKKADKHNPKKQIPKYKTSF